MNCWEDGVSPSPRPSLWGELLQTLPKTPASITLGDPLPEETQASLFSLLELNLFQTEAVSLLSAVEVALVNHSLLKISRNQQENVLKKAEVSQEDISGWRIPSFVW